MEDWLTERAKTSPHRLALIIGDDQWSYAELNDLASIYADRLTAVIQPGQNVGVFLPNCVAYVGLIHALARVGAVLVPLNTRLTINEISWQLDHTDCTLLLTTNEKVNQFSNLEDHQRKLLLVEDLSDPLNTKEDAERPPFSLNNKQAIIFTSGTTGQPKGAVMSFANHYWSAMSSAFRLGLHEDDRWLCCLPLYHVGGLAIILRSCLYGTAVVLHERFDENEINQSMESKQITLISLVPTMVYRLLKPRGNKPWPNTLRHVLLGGAAASEDLIQRCQELDIPLSITYGLTEAASQVATILPKKSREKPGSVGKPLFNTSVTIVDDQGKPAPPGEIGEVCVEGPTIMTGYYKDEQSTASAIRNGRLHTGDLGYLDQDGDLWLIQRRKDIIITGGENVYPSEVEKTLLQHPAVAAICVVGITDKQWGQRVGAMIELYDDMSLTSEELLEFGRKRLAGYKLPRELLFVDKLPLTGSGKIHRQAVSDSFNPAEII